MIYVPGDRIDWFTVSQSLACAMHNYTSILYTFYEKSDSRHPRRHRQSRKIYC